jgi:hypothetical protein
MPDVADIIRLAVAAEQAAGALLKDLFGDNWNGVTSTLGVSVGIGIGDYSVSVSAGIFQPSPNPQTLIEAKAGFAGRADRDSCRLL